ncbi:YjcQ family protein [Bacillus mycoides]|uniref:YjcQ family protein n=1 Tax=Bacillus mycoides TaxID=1405 RepID=UPI0022B45B88|nr:YjcQ family protein [Bacillus mycoides]
MDVKEIICQILEAINADEKDITADKLEVDETTFRDLCELVEDNNLAVGIDCQYLEVDFSNAKVTLKGEKYLRQKSI